MEKNSLFKTTDATRSHRRHGGSRLLLWQRTDTAKMLSRLRLAAVGWTLLAVVTTALEPGLPSKTAVYIAAARAIGARNPDDKQRNPDYLAIKFLGPRERMLLPDYPVDAIDLPFKEAL